MKRKLNYVLAVSLVLSFSFLPLISEGQGRKSFIKNFMTELPKGKVSNALQKFKMTAVYSNRDINGNFTGKTLVTGGNV